LAGNKGKVTFGYPDLPECRSAQDAANFMKFRSKTGFIPGMRPKYYHAVLVPNEGIMQSWHNPFHVTAFTDKWRKNRYTGVRPKLGPHPVLEHREKVYARELTMEEWIQVGTVSPIDQRIIMSVMSAEWTTSDITELASELRRYPNFGYLFNYVPDRGDISLVVLKNLKIWFKICKKQAESVKSSDFDPYVPENPDPDLGDSWLEFSPAVSDLQLAMSDEPWFEQVYVYDEFGDPKAFEAPILEEPVCINVTNELDRYVYDDEVIDETLGGSNPWDDVVGDDMPDYGVEYTTV